LITSNEDFANLNEEYEQAARPLSSLKIIPSPPVSVIFIQIIVVVVVSFGVS